jgi:hypothetical protein
MWRCGPLNAAADQHFLCFSLADDEDFGRLTRSSRAVSMYGRITKL